MLGVPQFTVIADMKKGLAEDQLALFVSFCALKYAIENVDTSWKLKINFFIKNQFLEPILDFQFTFRIYFNMDLDGSKRECNACGNIVHLVERLIFLLDLYLVYTLVKLYFVYTLFRAFC